MRRHCTKCRFIKVTLVCVFLSSLLCYISLSQTPLRNEDHYKESEPLGQKLTILNPPMIPKIVCKGSPKGSDNDQLKWKLTDMTPPKFLSNFKNPCFYWNTTLTSGPHLRTVKQIQCLPYFFIAGFPKSGTSDVWVRLYNHPDVVINHAKELNFFNRQLFVGNDAEPPSKKYVEKFARTSFQLQKLISPAKCQGPFPYYYGVTGEASVDTVFDTPRWQHFPENENCLEPRITNANYVHRLMPNLKVILLMRNPVDRLYSDYIYEARYLHYNLSRQDFHRTVLQTIQSHRQCQEKFPIRACAYNSSIETYKARLRVGMYHIFVRDWLNVFPGEQILILKTEDMVAANMRSIYRKICHFLDIRPFTKEEEARILNTAIRVNKRNPAERQLGQMWNETRKILTEFYSSHNENLAELLSSDKFLWND